MVKVILCALFALCLVVNIDCFNLDQCPPGYRCRKKIVQRRSIPLTDHPMKEGFEIEICPPGTYSPGGATECTPCKIGTFAPRPGASFCYDCPKGSMCPRANMEPEQCPLGTYNDLTRQICCRSCPPGKITSLKGMLLCHDCPSGYRCEAKPKLACNESEQIILPSIPINTKWKQHGVTIAGGNGRGHQLNQLDRPLSTFIDDDQTIYVADTLNYRIVKWKKNAMSGQIVAGGNGKGNGSNQFNEPTDMLVDKENDSLIICDRNNRRVIRWPRQNGQNGEILISNIDCHDLIMDNDGYLYVSDFKKHEIRRWKMGEMNGIIVAGGNGQGNRLDQLDHPWFIFIDEDHSVYVSDCNNHRVMKWMKGAKEGIVVVGGQGQGNSLRQLSNPHDVIVDQLGSVYVVDIGNNRVMRWWQGAKEGTIVVGGNGQGAQSNQLNFPQDLSFDRENNLYIVDWQNDRIQKFDVI